MKKTAKKLKRALACMLAVVMVLCAVPMSGDVLTAGAVSIPSDAAELNGHRYKAFDGPLSWHDAKMYCENLGGHLVTITSKEENDFILNLIKETNYTVYLIGFTDEKEEGNWEWVTGEAVTYTNWGINSDGHSQPDNWYEPDGQNYGAIVSRYTYGMGDAGTWDDTFSDSSNGDYCSNGSFSFICEWESVVFPDGYDFYEDSYQFENDKSENISKRYYTTIFESATADIIYSETHKTDGLCYGFAYTTAAIYNDLPAISRFEYLDSSGSNTATKIRDLNRSTLFGSAVFVGGEYNMPMYLYDYIKYAYIYQYSQEALDLLYSTANDIQGLYRTVKELTDNDRIGVVIGFSKRESAPENAPGGHEVLAIGYDGNDILIDNPNNASNFERLTINDDGTWNFGKYNSTHHVIDYAVNIHRPYQILLTGTKVTPWDSVTQKGNIESKDECYIDGIDRIDAEYSILSINGDNFELNSNDYLEIPKDSKSGANESGSDSDNRLFWIKDTKTLKVSGLSNSETILKYGGDDTVFEAILLKGSEATFTIDDGNNSMNVKTDVGNKTLMSVNSIDDTGEKTTIEINGISSSDTVTATQTETGLVVTGISDGTVTLSKDDEEIETRTITNSVSDIEITYDKTGESEDISLDYETPHEHSYTSEVVLPTCTEDGKTVYTCSCGDTYTEVLPATGHTDKNADGKCDTCGETLDAVKNCTHLCHKSGFLGFIWKIVNFFCKLFKINPVCSCGVKHY